MKDWDNKREGLTFEEWARNMNTPSKGNRLVNMYGLTMDPCTPPLFPEPFVTIPHQYFPSQSGCYTDLTKR